MTVIFSVIYGATVFAITTPGLVPEQVLWLGQAANIPMVVLGKMIQVIANFRQGHRFFDQVWHQTTYILLEKSIHSLNYVIIRPTKIMNNLLTYCKILTSKSFFSIKN